MSHSLNEDTESAQALVNVIGSSRWDAVAIARAYLALRAGSGDGEAARIIFEHGTQTLKRSRELIELSKTLGFVKLLSLREKKGSAENPITKLFPATVTEQRFLELLDALHSRRPDVTYVDDREAGHGLTDFTLLENIDRLPINVKNAGTPFNKALDLVGLSSDDCVPIPAYKAYAALETVPNLLYVISVDYALVTKLDELLPTLLSREEFIVWNLLNNCGGALLRNAEDLFIFSTVKKYWEQISVVAERTPFHVISARKAIRILQTKPRRTPGIGLRAWGTGASAEVNVHLSLREDTTPWQEVERRIVENGIIDILGAVNRQTREIVYDPEI